MNASTHQASASDEDQRTRKHRAPASSIAARPTHAGARNAAGVGEPRGAPAEPRKAGPFPGAEAPNSTASNDGRERRRQEQHASGPARCAEHGPVIDRAVSPPSDLELIAGAAEAALTPAHKIRVPCVSSSAREIGPQGIGEEDLGIREVPEQEIADPLLTAGPDEQVDARRQPASASDG